MLQGPGQFHDALKRLLHTQRDRADELFNTLEQESSALADGDADRLDALTYRKSDLLKQLQELGQNQQRLLDSLAFSDGDQGMDKALTWCDPKAELAGSRAATRRRLQQCRQLNERNGLAVQYRLGYVRRALDVLNGNPAGGSGTYGPDGRASASAPSRLLASG